MKNVLEYVKANWENTIHNPEKNIPYRFSVPCANVKNGFTDFYYWDTYFANLGLMLDGNVEQAENNLDVMAHFINTLGYVPNANTLLNRSQPPLFIRGVWNLYQFTKKKEVLEKYIEAMLAEYGFFRKNRMTCIGLNQYRSHISRNEALSDYSWIEERVGEKRDTETERLEFVEDMMAIAESGWDFTPRFHTTNRKFATREFVHLDLNCLLYDMEIKLADILEILGNTERALEYKSYAQERKHRMEQYMMDEKTGMFYDYNFVQGSFSSITSVASLYPYAVGLSDNKLAAKKVLKKLELKHGISACESRKNEKNYLQWDYPAMWPSNVYFAYVGLKKIGLDRDAKRVAHKYLKTVEKCFEKTGALWEKYDASKGMVSVTNEYETPEMMGWTAGVYRFLEEQLKADGGKKVHE